MIERCYKDFINFMNVDAEPENINHKFVVMNEVSELYDKLIREYKNVYRREPMDDKSDDWKQNYNPKSSKALDYQPAKPITESLSDENESDPKQLVSLK